MCTKRPFLALYIQRDIRKPWLVLDKSYLVRSRSGRQQGADEMEQGSPELFLQVLRGVAVLRIE